MSWLIYACGAALALAVHQMFYKLVSTHFAPIWAATLYQPVLFACLLPFAIYAWNQGIKPELSFQSSLAVIGLAVTGAAFIWLYQSAFKTSDSTAMVIVIADAGAVMVSVWLAVLLFGEVLTLQKIAGVGMAVTGIIIALKG
ncbi:MAG: EamA family transporter [Alphaproteobacteria bacterium]